MITNLPFYINIIFLLAIIYALIVFYFATNKNLKIIICLMSWGIFQSTLSFLGFYENTMTVPPRFLLMVIPMFMIVFTSWFSRKIKIELGNFDLKLITYLHLVRVPVEVVLYYLFTSEYVPELMTFKGLNFDVIIGLSAPIIALLVFRKKLIRKRLLLVWNIVSMLFLFNILFLAITTMPTVLQQFAFDQPNIAVMKFPFLLLPAVIVPIVLLSNVAGIVILTKKSNHCHRKI